MDLEARLQAAANEIIIFAGYTPHSAMGLLIRNRIKSVVDSKPDDAEALRRRIASILGDSL